MLAEEERGGDFGGDVSEVVGKILRAEGGAGLSLIGGAVAEPVLCVVKLFDDGVVVGIGCAFPSDA